MWVKYWPKWFSLYHNIVSVQVVIRCLLWRLYDSRWRLLWWICSTVHDYTLLIKYLYVTWCGSVPLDCSYVLLWIDTVVFYICSNCLEYYQQFIGDNHHLEEWWTEIFQTENSSEPFTPLVSLHGESDLLNIISNYSDEVWFREMMQLMMMVMLMI